MANAFSVPTSFGQYIPPVNLNLVNATLAAKQQKYDYNVAKVDSLLSEFSSIELVRDQDKQYLADRVNGVLNTVNEMQKDLSKNGQTRNIMQYINTAIDDKVLDQASNTIRLKNFEQSIAERKEKKPESYSDINYTFAKEQAGINDYLNGVDKEGKKVDSFGSLQYSEYKDVGKRINDFIIDIQNKKKDQVIEVPQLDENGQRTGAILQSTISGLSPVQIRQLAEGQLDAAHLQQIKINGWYNAGGYGNTEKINSDISQVYGAKVNNIDAQTMSLERKLSSGSLSPEDKSQIEADLNTYRTEKTRLEKEKTYLLSSPEAATTYIEKERVLSNAVEAFGGLYSKTDKLVKDELYFAQQDLNIKQLKLQHDIEKDTKSTTAPTIVTTLPTTTENNIPEIESFVDKSIDQYSSSVGTSLEAYKSALTTEAANGNIEASKFLEEYNKRLATKKPDETDNDVFSSMVSTVDYNSGLAILGNKNYVAQIKDDKEKLNLLLEGKKAANQEALNFHIDNTINSKEGLKAFYYNPDTKMMFNGKAYSVKNLLITNGVIDKDGNKIGDLKSKPNLFKELQKSYYADSYLSSPLKRREMLQNIAELIGESYTSVITDTEEEITNASPTTGATSTVKVKGYKLNPNSKTAQYIETAKQAGIYDTASWNDQSLSSDDSTIGRFLTKDFKDSDVYRTNLRKFYDKLPTSQVVGITSGDKDNFQRLSNLVTANTSTGTFIPDKTSTMNLRLDGDYVIISQPQEEKVDKQNAVVTKESKILKSDFMRAAPDIAKKLDFTTEASFYNIDKLEGKTLKSESIKYFDDSTAKKTYNWTTQVLLANKPQLIPYVDSTSARQAIYTSNKILEQRYGKEAFSTMLDSAMAKSSNFAINSTVEKDFNGNPYIDMKLVDKRTQKVIHSLTDSSQVNIDDFKKVLDNSPQVFYSLMVNDIFSREKQQMAIGAQSQSQSFQNLLSSL